jgi:putative membrane protein
MNNGDWNYGMGGGNWWWMAIIMFAILGGLVWGGVTLARHGNHTPNLQTPGAPPPSAGPTPQEVLAERLARGEIEADDYRKRLDALQHRPDA